MGLVVLARQPKRVSIRVLEVLASLERAGAERMVVSLVSGLDAARFETAVVSLYDAAAEGFEADLERRAIPVFHLGKRRGFDPRMYPRLMRVFRRFRPQIVHTHSYVLRYTYPACLAALPRSTRMVHTVHNLAEHEVDAVGRRIHAFAFRRGVSAVAIADEVARSFRQVYGFDPAATIPNGIDIVPFSQPGARDAWRRENGFAPDDGLAVSVARLDPQKNPLGLIEAFASALGGRPEWRLLLAGDGSLREAARACAERWGIGGRVHFLGVRKDVPELLSAGDLFVLASDWEGNPMSVMEALAAGLPVVATDVGGVGELVESGVTGLLVPPGNVPRLATALAALALDPDRRRAFAGNARAAAERFSAARMIESYARLFERLVEKPA